MKILEILVSLGLLWPIDLTKRPTVGLFCSKESQKTYSKDHVIGTVTNFDLHDNI